MEDNQQNDQPTESPSQPPFEDEPVQVVVPDMVYVSWSAKEFIEHKKSFGWFALFAAGLILLSIIVYLFDRSIFTVVIILLIGIAFAVIAGRSPKMMNYELNNLGVLVDKRTTSYGEFKSFSVIDEAGLGSIVFNPLKRFVFPTKIYYDLTDEEKIVGALTEHLPLEEAATDPIDQLMRKIRF